MTKPTNNYAHCVDCNRDVELLPNGTCSFCKSSSTFKRGVMKELELLMEQKNPLVIYHAACRDGFASAWVFWNRFGDKAEYYACFYGTDISKIPDVTGRDIYIVDFCFNIHEMTEICKKAKFVTVLDHHKTAQAVLEDFSAPNFRKVFDMNRSGAGIAWDDLNNSEARPWFIPYIEDRDLWRWSQENSRAVNYYLGVVPFTFVAWDGLLDMTPNKAGLFGDIIEQKVRQYCEEVSKNRVYFDLTYERILTEEGSLIKGSEIVTIQKVPIINAPQCDISELLEYMMEVEKTNFVMAFWQRADGKFQYSLRSKGDFDVTPIAKAYGGGGHKNAAGFQLPLPIHIDWRLEEYEEI